MTQVVCTKCNAKYYLSNNDMRKIERISNKETYWIKIDRFMCIKCIDKEYSQNGIEVKIEREKLDLDVDK